jgi:uncharacterized protein
MNLETILKKYYKESSLSYDILITHGKLVANKALNIAKKVPYFNPDIFFIYEAAYLHDIGIFKVNAPDIGCSGYLPYIAHGYIGKEILDNEGLKKHALVCERHVGTGISCSDVKKHNLPLPQKDMIPISIEEQIICYADKFFSKTPGKIEKEKSVKDILKSLEKFGESGINTFKKWVNLFEF